MANVLPRYTSILRLILFLFSYHCQIVLHCYTIVLVANNYFLAKSKPLITISHIYNRRGNKTLKGTNLE